MSEETVEQEIQDKGLTAPRLNPDHINATIATSKFIKATGTLTICVLTLKNGFTVTGESACVSPENYDQEVGEKIAFENARDKIWVLEGYLLQQEIFIGASKNV